jgi:DNA-directed RNA polymerase specialized sigma24 family protein
VTRTTDLEIWQLAAQVLTPKQLEALQLRYQQELPIATISDHLGITRQAVLERIATALRKLAKETHGPTPRRQT